MAIAKSKTKRVPVKPSRTKRVPPELLTEALGAEEVKPPIDAAKTGTVKRSPRSRSRRKPEPVEEVTFTARFHENPRAGLKCTCVFPDKCDGSRVVACHGLPPPEAGCNCEACPVDITEHVNGCAGCENCLASVCVGCGKRDPSVPAVEGESWTCSPECTRKTFTVAS